MRKAGLEAEIARLERLRAGHIDDQLAIRRQIRDAEREIERSTRRISEIGQDIVRFVPTADNALPDLADAAGGALDLALGIAKLAADGMLVVEMGGAEPLRAGRSRREPALCIRRGSPEAIALASANWFAWRPGVLDPRT